MLRGEAVLLLVCVEKKLGCGMQDAGGGRREGGGRKYEVESGKYEARPESTLPGHQVTSWLPGKCVESLCLRY